MKNRKVNVKDIIHFIKEAWKDEQKKAIIMLIFMFIFFGLIIISIRTSNNSNNYIESSNKEENFDFSLSKIEKGNYHFIYTVNIDNNITKYEGDSNYGKELFNINDNDKYYKYGYIYLKDINGIWSKIDKIYLYSEFKEIDNIKKILKQSSFDSKTEYKDSNKIYNYNISTTTLLKILENIDIDIEDIPNKITIITDNENNVIEIDYDISPYSLYIGKGNLTTINLKYTSFGEIEDIEDPK